jgi:hypothetical protein
LALGAFVALLSVAATKAPQLVNTLDNSRSELARFLATLETVRSPQGVDALPVVMDGEGLSSVHRVEERPVRLSGETARALSKSLLDAASYQGGMSACLFQPAVALRFRSEQGVVEALVCFHCSELVFEGVDGHALSGRLRFGLARASLLAAAKEAFPQNQAIQALK